jgi:hypothetical protein
MLEFSVGDFAEGVGDGAVVDERHFVTLAGQDVSVHRIVADVELPATKPDIFTKIIIFKRVS